MRAARVEAWIWPLIYGGLFVVAIGIALTRHGEAYGWGACVAGSASVAVGVCLIWVRSRMHDRSPSTESHEASS